MYKLSKSAGAQFPLNHALRHVHEFALEFDSIRVLCVLHLQHHWICEFEHCHGHHKNLSLTHLLQRVSECKLCTSTCAFKLTLSLASAHISVLDIQKAKFYLGKV